MKALNFKTQICTTREQSERLLALGLKKETADMWYPRFAPSFPIPLTEDDYVHELNNDGDVPAWSLHRLWELDNINYIQLDNKEEIAKLYDCIIDNIEAQIKEGIFNKDYLED